jgi:hypothetical protein
MRTFRALRVRDGNPVRDACCGKSGGGAKRAEPWGIPFAGLERVNWRPAAR